MVAGISDVLNRSGYRLLLANTDNNIEEELKYLNLFKDNQVDGILFIATMFTAKHRKLLKECKVPVVILGQRLEGYSCVYQDDYHAALKMTQALHENGDKIGYIGVTDKDEAAGLNRRRGYEAALRKAGKKPCQNGWQKQNSASSQAMSRCVAFYPGHRILILYSARQTILPPGQWRT